MDTKIIRLPQVKEMVGLGTTAIYDKMKHGDFPKQIKLGRLSGWVESEVQAWIEKLANTREVNHVGDYAKEVTGGEMAEAAATEMDSAEIGRMASRYRDGSTKAALIMKVFLSDEVTVYGRDAVIRDNPIDAITLSILFNLAIKHQHTLSQRLNGAARAAKDPKAADKTLVKEMWDAWQGKPNSYKSKAAFARDMLDKFPLLSNQKVIEGWCRDWEKNSYPAG